MLRSDRINNCMNFARAWTKNKKSTRRCQNFDKSLSNHDGLMPLSLPTFDLFFSSPQYHFLDTTSEAERQIFRVYCYQRGVQKCQDAGKLGGGSGGRGGDGKEGMEGGSVACFPTLSVTARVMSA